MRLIQNVVRTSYEYLSMCACVYICKRKQSETQQKAEAAPEDSDLDRKRRETEALLQSIGISPEPSLGTVHRPLDRTEISFCTAATSLNNASLQNTSEHCLFTFAKIRLCNILGSLHVSEWDFIQTSF